MQSATETVVITWLGACAVMIILFLGLFWRIEQLEDKIDGATIGGTTVPAVRCAEEEVISWLGPDRLGCVHYEEVN